MTSGTASAGAGQEMDKTCVIAADRARSAAGVGRIERDP